MLGNPVPNNLDQVEKLDSFLGDILKDRHKQCVVDPLTKLWILVEEVRTFQITIALDNIRSSIVKRTLLSVSVII